MTRLRQSASFIASRLGEADAVLAMPSARAGSLTASAPSGLREVPSLSQITTRAVEPNERLHQLFRLDRPFTETEAREWAELTEASDAE